MTLDKECHLDMLTSSIVSVGHGNDLVTNMMGKTTEMRLSGASGLERLDHLNNKNRVSDPMCVSTGENDGVGIDQ